MLMVLVLIACGATAACTLAGFIDPQKKVVDGLGVRELDPLSLKLSDRGALIFIGTYLAVVVLKYMSMN